MSSLLNNHVQNSHPNFSTQNTIRPYHIVDLPQRIPAPALWYSLRLASEKNKNRSRF
jgi:hypothetical protein